MADESFETWARREIVRLRSEADVIERVLARYLNDTAVRSPVAPATNGHLRKASKYDPLIQVWRQAGRHGLTLDQLAAETERLGIRVPRQVLRSMIWTKKRDGHVRPVGDRYAWVGLLEEGGEDSRARVS